MPARCSVLARKLFPAPNSRRTFPGPVALGSSDGVAAIEVLPQQSLTTTHPVEQNRAIDRVVPARTLSAPPSLPDCAHDRLVLVKVWPVFGRVQVAMLPLNEGRCFVRGDRHAAALGRGRRAP